MEPWSSSVMSMELQRNPSALAAPRVPQRRSKRVGFGLPASSSAMATKSVLWNTLRSLKNASTVRWE